MKNQSEYLTSRKKYKRYNNAFIVLLLTLSSLGFSSWSFGLDIENTMWLKVAILLCGAGMIFCMGFATGWEEKEMSLYDSEGSEGNGDISEKDLEQDGEITLFEGKPFTGVCVDYFKEDTSDPTSHHKYEKHYEDGKMDGLYTIWYHIGYKASEAYYKNGKNHGSRVCWFDEDRKMKEENYENDMQEGLQIDYYYNHAGIWHEKYFKNDEQDGTSTSYYDNGKKEREEHYKEGIENGVRTEWNEDGNKIYQGKFVQKLDLLDVEIGEEPSEKEGLHAEWHTNGKKKTEKHYKNGIENGIRKEWDEDGKLTFQGNFVDGVEEIK